MTVTGATDISQAKRSRCFYRLKAKQPFVSRISAPSGLLVDIMEVCTYVQKRRLERSFENPMGFLS